MNWWQKYIGLPYSKYNCGQLVALVAGDRYGIKIHVDEAPKHPIRRDRFLQSVFSGYVCEKIEKPEEGSIALMSGRTLISHVGMVVGADHDFMLLHSSIEFGSVCAHRLVDLPIHGLMISGAHGEGFYRLCR